MYRPEPSNLGRFSAGTINFNVGFSDDNWHLPTELFINVYSLKFEKEGYNVFVAFWAGHYAAEKEFFEKTVAELLDISIRFMESSERILIIYHPHIHHIEPDERGVLWKQNVPEILRNKAAERGVSFYDGLD